MYIEKTNNNGTAYLRLCENRRILGSQRVSRKVVLNIGPLDRVSDGKPDFLERLRQSFREGHPILSVLQPYAEPEPEEIRVETVCLEFPVKGETPDGVFINKLFADMILNAYMKELGLAHLLTTIKSRSRIEYDLLGFVKILVYGRILAPASKWATVKQNGSYYTPILADGFNPYNVYDALDVVYKHSDSIFHTINTALSRRPCGRDTSIIFYDLTNFYFEIEQNDPDILNDDGVVVEEGLRKRGHSKESRPQPIVQMGLFIDRNGIPIGIRSFPGNRTDKTTLIEATTEVLTPMGYERYIYCADRGLCTLANLAFLVGQGLGYLLSKSIKQSKKEDRDWIIEPKGYTEEKNGAGEVVFKYKHTEMTRTYTDENGKTTMFKEKVVAFWSLEVQKHEEHMMESFAKFLKKLETETKSFTLSAGQIKKIRQFLKDEVLDSLDPEKDKATDQPAEEAASAGQSATDPADAGEKPVDKGTGSADEDAGTPSPEKKPRKRKKLTQEEKDRRAAEKKAEAARQKALKEARKKRLDEQLKDSATTRTMIDWEKVNRWRDFNGYYQIVTSELEMDDMEVIRTYRKLTQVENRFRTMKGPLDCRPIFLQNPDHIKAHLILCTIALAIMVLIQNKAGQDREEGESEAHAWFVGMSPDRVQDALNALQVETLPQGYFRFRARSEDQAGRDLQTILDAFDITLESRLYTPGQLRSLRGGIKVL